MKGIVCFGLLVTIISYTPASAQEASPDTMLMVKLPMVEVNADRRWDNDTIRYRYNQTKYYITTILPYLNEASRLYTELNAKINEPGVGKKERKAFVGAKEDELRDKFGSEIRMLNETQGVLLVKLIARQTGANLYTMLDEFKNPFEAIKWQTWARLNGFNLNKRYNPEDEPMLEHIMENLGYPLPAVYGEVERTALKNEQVKYPKR